ncbi:MAG: shikimate dehydrogenase [Gammaproteobacteria bacterium]|nr:shikimate dehydrogenase [Gammaproteobacteria bacterium]MCP5137319.1 shikimate dehydrogenase [Gammaproteobacteria bacterium]
MTDRYAVMGNPIGHSKSPKIHALFAAQTGQDLSYDALLVATDGFAAALDEFQANGGCGLNITVPFKQDAWAAMTSLSDRARRAGAVNTIVLHDNGRRHGDNTDGIGLVRDLGVNHGVDLLDKDILVLGAGGAVRGVLQPLLAENPAMLVIANRTVSKAQALAHDFADLGTVTASGFAELADCRFDVIINGTAAGLSGEVPPIPDHILKPGGACYDMVYSDVPTAFVNWAQARRAGVALDGLGMLVEQAAESFYIWRGVRPDTAAVIHTLRP